MVWTRFAWRLPSLASNPAHLDHFNISITIRAMYVKLTSFEWRWSMWVGNGEW
ncbi:hypothetical protein WOLCODRAFT_149663 [Wolfiporia cocos MD-104 SS10]|uniref:Uncharacterized protein n=1 Tax=Wolfiporia cocos (strain MD-104) TaxID=742152 RepID=A0A2H3JAV5_WOLCO|nr:hypothetical protein WOLCODRAFT_149663 [Wolfiporia cocos MD-104 SS10]